MDTTEALPVLTVTGLCCLEEVAPTTAGPEWLVRTSTPLLHMGTGDCVAMAGRLWATSSEACVEEGASASPGSAADRAQGRVRRDGSDAGLTGWPTPSVCGAAALPEKLLEAHAVLRARGSARAQQMQFREGDLGKQEPSDVCEVRCARHVTTRRSQAGGCTPTVAQGAVSPHPRALPSRPGRPSQLCGSWVRQQEPSPPRREALVPPIRSCPEAPGRARVGPGPCGSRS